MAILALMATLTLGSFAFLGLLLGPLLVTPDTSFLGFPVCSTTALLGTCVEN